VTLELALRMDNKEPYSPVYTQRTTAQGLPRRPGQEPPGTHPKIKIQTSLPKDSSQLPTSRRATLRLDDLDWRLPPGQTTFSQSSASPGRHRPDLTRRSTTRTGTGPIGCAPTHGAAPAMMGHPGAEGTALGLDTDFRRASLSRYVFADQLGLGRPPCRLPQRDCA
jgi:hypothetical protein